MRKLFMTLALALAIVTMTFGMAMADSVLFPYFKSGGGDATFIQLINTASVLTSVTVTAPNGNRMGRLDYVYVYNSGNEVCMHYDDKGRMTQNDILLYEPTSAVTVSSTTNQLLPNDTTSTAPRLPLSTPSWGYLVVRHNTADFADTISTESKLFGQAYVINLSSGVIYTYNAINDPDETLLADNGAFISNAPNISRVSFMPESYASTSWFYFPVDGYDLFNYIVTDATLRFGDSNMDFASNPSVDGVWDQNESLKSGIKTLLVGCTTQYGLTGGGDPYTPVQANFIYTLQQSLSAAQYNVVKNTGGFTNVTYNETLYYSDSVYGYTYKLQSSNALGRAMNIMMYEPSGADADSNSVIGATSSYTK